MGRAMKGVEPLARDFFGVKPHRLACSAASRCSRPLRLLRASAFCAFKAVRPLVLRFSLITQMGFLPGVQRVPLTSGATLGQADGQLASLLQSFHASLMSRAIQ